MPTVEEPRITIRVTHEQREKLRRLALAKGYGSSEGKIIRDWIDGAPEPDEHKSKKGK